jgi:hypothetical protein
MSGLELIQTVASVATVVGVVLGLQQLRLIKRQATTTFEDRLTGQYRRIMRRIPTDIWLGSELTALTPELRGPCRDAIYQYIDLSNEEAVLHNQKRITEEAWIEWRKGIETNMKLPAFAGIWAEVNERSPASFEELRALEEQDLIDTPVAQRGNSLAPDASPG